MKQIKSVKNEITNIIYLPFIRKIDPEKIENRQSTENHFLIMCVNNIS